MKENVEFFFLICITNLSARFTDGRLEHRGRSSRLIINEFHSVAFNTFCTLQAFCYVLVQATTPPRLEVEWLEIIENGTRLIDVVAV